MTTPVKTRLHWCGWPFECLSCKWGCRSWHVDAFLIDSAAPIVEPAHYSAPTLHVLDESAVRPAPASISPNHVTWEVIGAPHLDQLAASHLVTPSPGELPPLLNREEEEARWMNFENLGIAPSTVALQCTTQFPRHFAMNAALVALREWLKQAFLHRSLHLSSEPNTHQRPLACR